MPWVSAQVPARSAAIACDILSPANSPYDRHKWRDFDSQKLMGPNEGESVWRVSEGTKDYGENGNRFTFTRLQIYPRQASWLEINNFAHDVQFGHRISVANCGYTLQNATQHSLHPILRINMNKQSPVLWSELGYTQGLPLKYNGWTRLWWRARPKIVQPLWETQLPFSRKWARRWAAAHIPGNKHPARDTRSGCRTNRRVLYCNYHLIPKLGVFPDIFKIRDHQNTFEIDV